MNYPSMLFLLNLYSSVAPVAEVSLVDLLPFLLFCAAISKDVGPLGAALTAAF